MLRAAHPPERHAIRIRWFLPWFLGMATVAIVWGLAIHTLTTPKPVAVRLHPDAVVWGDRVFANRTQFARWLNSRGLSYEAWAKKHPGGEAIISGRKRTASTTRPAAARVASKPAPPVTRTVASSAASPLGMIVAYFLVALVIAGLAFPPVVTVGAPFLGPRAFRLLASRVYVAAAAASAAIGLLAAHAVA